MEARRVWGQLLLTTWWGRILLLPLRFFIAVQNVWHRMFPILPWLLRSREFGVETYRTTRLNQIALCSTLAVVTGKPASELRRYLDEIDSDVALHDYLRSVIRASQFRWSLDHEFGPGRRLAYYLLIRALRPRFVVEAGVKHGFGALLISRALARNREEGDVGEYLGLELQGKYDSFIWRNYPDRVGKIEYGDSASLIAELQAKIDCFIHETTSEPEHVIAQLSALLPRLSENSVIASPWLLPELIEYAEAHHKSFLVHQEDPDCHWYAGSKSIFVFRALK